MHARRSSVSIKKASAIPTVFRPIESLPVLEDPRGHIGPVSSRAVADKAPVAVPRHKCALHWPGGRQELVQRLGRAARSRRPDRERLEPARPRHWSERLLYRALPKPSLPKRKMRPDNQLSKSPGLLLGSGAGYTAQCSAKPVIKTTSSTARGRAQIHALRSAIGVRF